MEQHKQKDVFTAGELAAIFGISKQALLYYDRIQLLSPAYISANGYRHYSIDQYLDLEIIIGLRSLNIPVAEIKDYLQQRSPQQLQQLLQHKDKECAAIIAENERIRRSLKVITSQLEQISQLEQQAPRLVWHDERLLRLTPLQDCSSGKEKIASFAGHYYRTQHSKATPGRLAGWMVQSQDFFQQGDFPRSQAYFSFSTAHHGWPDAEKLSLPAGLYLELYFKGTFCKQAAALAQQVQDFLQPRNLVAMDHVFVLPVANHWLYPSTQQYLTQLFLQVKQL